MQETEEDFEEEFILDANEIQEELEVGGQEEEGEGIPEEEEEERDMELDEDEGYDGQEEQQQFDFKDDSIQGFFDHKEPVFAVAIHPTNMTIAVSGGSDDKSYLWSMENGDKLCDLAAHADSCCAVAFSNDGKYVASGGMDGKLFIFQSDSGTPVVTLEGPSEITWIQWHPRGHVILAASEDGTIWMWQVPSGNCMNVFTGHSESVTCGQWAPDGKSIVTGSSDGTIMIWDPKTGAAIHKWTQHDGRFHQAPITALAVNKDNTIIASGDQSGVTLLLQIATEKIIGPLQAHEESVETIQFAEGNLPYIATGAVDGKIHVWDIASNHLRFSVEHKEAVTKVRFNNFSGHLVSCSIDGSVCIWDARTGSLLRSLQGHQAGVLDFDIRKDGSVMLTGSDDGTALVFPLTV